MFGRATITLGIGPHSSFYTILRSLQMLQSVRGVGLLSQVQIGRDRIVSSDLDYRRRQLRLDWKRPVARIMRLKGGD